jgi:hypothetical protein
MTPLEFIASLEHGEAKAAALTIYNLMSPKWIENTDDPAKPLTAECLQCENQTKHLCLYCDVCLLCCDCDDDEEEEEDEDEEEQRPTERNEIMKITSRNDKPRIDPEVLAENKAWRSNVFDTPFNRQDAAKQLLDLRSRGTEGRYYASHIRRMAQLGPGMWHASPGVRASRMAFAITEQITPTLLARLPQPVTAP